MPCFFLLGPKKIYRSRLFFEQVHHDEQRLRGHWSVREAQLCLRRFLGLSDRKTLKQRVASSLEVVHSFLRKWSANCCCVRFRCNVFFSCQGTPELMNHSTMCWAKLFHWSKRYSIGDSWPSEALVVWCGIRWHWGGVPYSVSRLPSKIRRLLKNIGAKKSKFRKLQWNSIIPNMCQ